MPVAAVEGLDIFYEEAGQGPAVVFSHGFLMDHEMFDRQLEALSGSSRCVAWDQRGHGGTPCPGSFTYWDSADDLLGLMDHLGIEDAFLVGMSQGGFVSLRAALTAPARVRGLFLIDTQAGLESDELRPMYDAMVQTWVSGGPDRELAETVAGILVGPEDHEPWIAKWMARPPEVILTPYATLMGREDIGDRLHEITCPALVVHGEKDDTIPLERAEALCEGLPGCEGLVVVPGAPHAPNVSHPDEVNAGLRSFLERHA
jgi:3-oxoadipate enol-lactonase